MLFLMSLFGLSGQFWDSNLKQFMTTTLQKVNLFSIHDDISVSWDTTQQMQLKFFSVLFNKYRTNT